MTGAIQDRHDFAVALAVEAGQLAETMQRGLGPLEVKSPIDFCTEADRAVERLVRDRIRDRFGDVVVGEEYGGQPGDDVWLVDPIDGTTEYIHGTKRWCVSLAYVHAGVIEVGAIYAPADDRLFSAKRNGGAFLNGRRLEVSRLRHGAGGLVEVGWSDRRPVSAYGALLGRLIAAGLEFRRHGSGALALAEVAAGLNDGYIELHINAWDALAGILLVQEAGGSCNDFLAGNGLTHGNLLVASTPEIWQTLMTLAV